jgi:tetratricopeptide (TPR) repeat protein
MAVVLSAADMDAAREAEKELFAARYDHAAELYSRLVHDDPGFAAGYYGLVRAYIAGYRAQEGYSAAEEAVRHVAETAEGQTAAAMAAWRRGDVIGADRCFKKAFKLNPNFAGALYGLSLVYSSISKFKSARGQVAAAHQLAPNDPEMIEAWANTLQGKEHIAGLERALTIFDPASREARMLRAHIAGDKSVGERKLRRLITPYQSYEIKLDRLLDGPNRSAPDCVSSSTSSKPSS